MNKDKYSPTQMNTYLITFIGNWKAHVQGYSYAHAYSRAMRISHVVKMICVIDVTRSL